MLESGEHMEFKLNIETLTETIDGYDEILKILNDEKQAIISRLNELYKGWTGEARNRFETLYKENLSLYNELEENLKYVKDILKDVE